MEEQHAMHNLEDIDIFFQQIFENINYNGKNLDEIICDALPKIIVALAKSNLQNYVKGICILCCNNTRLNRFFANFTKFICMEATDSLHCFASSCYIYKVELINGKIRFKNDENANNDDLEKLKKLKISHQLKSNKSYLNISMQDFQTVFKLERQLHMFRDRTLLFPVIIPDNDILKSIAIIPML